MDKKPAPDLKELKNLSKDSFFKDAFEKLCLNKELSFTEKEFLLSCALLFFDYYNSNRKFKSYFKIGFYIILKYAIKYNDYKPLYDISLQIGFYPITEYITHRKKKLHKVDSKNSILDALTFISYKKKFRSSENYIESYEQSNSRNLIIKSKSHEIAYIAPTSYGKSSLIREFISSNNFSRIAVIVPTKSLLVQTYNDIKALGTNYKLILHDEMYNGENKFVGILTQERAIRILNKNVDIDFEVIFIDEAHKILDRDQRSYILSRLIQLNYKRNNKQKLIYLSPLIEDEINLKIKKTKQGKIFGQKIEYDFKSFELYLFDNKNWLFYDKFTDTEFQLNRKSGYFEYIIKNSNNKNFIFHSRPVKVEELAKQIAEKLDENLAQNENIKKIIETLKNEVHKSFYAINYVATGVIYIHAKIPNIIKEYLEEQFKTIEEIKYIVANSVILEGVNLPIDTIFITTNKTGNRGESLKIKDLINLVGRANRLNEVFNINKNNFSGLVSKVHFLNHPDFQGKRDIRSSLKNLREYSFNDVVKNPLIETYDIEKLKFSGKKDEIEERKNKMKIEDENLIKFSDYILKNPTNKKERIKKYFIENSLDKFFDNLDSSVDAIIKNISNYKFSSEDRLIEIINLIVIEGNEDNIRDFELERLKHNKARNYYNHFLTVTQKQHLNERINETLNYFKTKANSEDPYLYIGTSYGEENRISKKYTNDHYTGLVYIDLRQDDNKLVNIAIVKLKIEEDLAILHFRHIEIL